MRREDLALACVALIAACADPSREPPRWIELARGFQPRPLAEVVHAWQPGAATDGRSWKEEFQGVRIELALPAAAWTPAYEPGGWTAALPEDGAFPFLQHHFVRLTAGEHQFAWARTKDELDPGKFTIAGARLWIRLPPGEPPPENALLSERLENGRPVGGGWQVRVGTLNALGIPVWTGLREEVACEIPPRSALSFVAQFAGATDAGPVRFRVLLDGETLVEHERSPDGERVSAVGSEWIQEGGSTDGTYVVLPLPAKGASGARIAFEAVGAPGLVVFFQPVIGPLPAEHGYGARPWSEPRPDIVLFLADTFRADNLAFHGGDPDLAPNLNRMAQLSLRFSRARSTAAWTLPAIGSLLTGMYPGQHGASQEGLGLSPALDTIVEELAHAGYRTGAITDGSFFSAEFGTDQGFQWFVQRTLDEWELTRTIDDAIAFLERDDGRPVFLVVHTYRAHAPYRQGPDEDASRWDAVMEELGGEAEAARLAGKTGFAREILVRHRERLTELYRDGVRDLDQEFGRLWAALGRLGVLDGGVALFTSDHGEALGENQDIFHGRALWEVKLRIPLLIYSGDLGARDVPWTVSLVDVAPTIAALAQVPRSEHWAGASLLTLAEERPGYAFRLDERGRQIAVFDQARKLLSARAPETLGQGECDAAYDLAADPREEHDLSRIGAEWPAELARRAAPAVAELLTPRTDPIELELGPELMQELQDIGYGGDANR